ncbi:MAG: hypothetical protein ACR2KC_07325 [Acidimicrobiales bacterium]
MRAAWRPGGGLAAGILGVAGADAALVYEGQGQIAEIMTVVLIVPSLLVLVFRGVAVRRARKGARWT